MKRTLGLFCAAGVLLLLSGQVMRADSVVLDPSILNPVNCPTGPIYQATGTTFCSDGNTNTLSTAGDNFTVDNSGHLALTINFVSPVYAFSFSANNPVQLKGSGTFDVKLGGVTAVYGSTLRSANAFYLQSGNSFSSATLLFVNPATTSSGAYSSAVLSNFQYSTTPAATPEPATMFLFAPLAGAGLFALRRKKA